MKCITGVPASPGLVYGTVRYLRHTQSGLGRAVRTPAKEQKAFDEAAAEAKRQLEQLEHKAAAQDRGIFMVQRILLEDGELLQEIASYIRAGAGAAAAVERAGGIFANRIRSLDDPYLRERACDIMDACRRVVKVLDGRMQEAVILEEPSIIAAQELYPTDIVMLDRKLVIGIITSKGSPNAHASIIARTMGIPAIVCAGREILDDCDGRPIAMDGDTGEAYLEPDEATKALFIHRMRLERRYQLSHENLRKAPCITRDGTRLRLMADCATAEDVRAAVQAGADGVGMLLSEYLLAAENRRGEQESFQFYQECLQSAQGRPVTICTFDVGPNTEGVQSAHKEPNPALGLCGVRYCLSHPDFFETQLRALLRAGQYGRLRILLPMVTTREELDAVMRTVHRVKMQLRAQGLPFAENVPIGACIETPAAALTADELACRSAFFTVNTNQLMQYTYAADRVNPQMQGYLPASSRAVYRLVSSAVQAAAQAKIPLCLCGDGAQQPALAEAYARLGVREFSLPARGLLEIKEYLMGISL